MMSGGMGCFSRVVKPRRFAIEGPVDLEPDFLKSRSANRHVMEVPRRDAAAKNDDCGAADCSPCRTLPCSFTKETTGPPPPPPPPRVMWACHPPGACLLRGPSGLGLLRMLPLARAKSAQRWQGRCTEASRCQSVVVLFGSFGDPPVQQRGEIHRRTCWCHGSSCCKLFPFAGPSGQVADPLSGRRGWSSWPFCDRWTCFFLSGDWGFGG